MYVHEVRCLSLGIKEKQAGEYNGKPTPAYTCLNFVVFDEDTSRRAYLEDSALKAQAFQIAGKWGTEFFVSGEISAKGSLSVDSIAAADSPVLGIDY